MKKIYALSALLLVMQPALAHAEDLCESSASVHQRARYCHQNWAFIQPAQTCTAEFKRLLEEERARLQKILGGHVQKGNGNAQNGNFDTGKNVFASSLDDVNYLLDFGKQVHTELEDYVSDLTPPVFEPGEAGDASDPAVKARYMASSECYSDPVNLLEDLQMQMRPQIAELEKVKKQLTLMAGVNLTNDTGMQNSTKAGALKPGAAPARNDMPVSGKPRDRESNVSGKSNDVHLPK